MKLSKTDKAILDSYAFMIDGLADYLGSACEISLHSLEDYDRSVVKIKNGYHSGRTEGAPLTDLALNMLKRIQEYGLSSSETYTSYKTVNTLGERIKASTIPVLNDSGKVIGMLCINLYLDSPLSEILETLFGIGSPVTEYENFASNAEETLSKAVGDARLAVLHNAGIHPNNANKEIIRLLYDKGIFRMKNAVVDVAEILGISKNTVYLHLRSIEKNNTENQ